MNRRKRLAFIIIVGILGWFAASRMPYRQLTPPVTIEQRFVDLESKVTALEEK